MKTIDRYLLARYFYIFGVFFTAAMGLFMIADGFTNLDDFQKRASDSRTAATQDAPASKNKNPDADDSSKARDGGSRSLLAIMGKHYLYQSSRIFSLAGPTLAVMSAMCVMALTLKHGEINPLLAAGVPLYRVAMPLVIGVVSINGLLTINEELIIPRIAMHLQGKHGDTGDDAQSCEPTYDNTWMIIIGGDALIPDERKIRDARFVVPRSLASKTEFLLAKEAVYFPERRDRPAGWLLEETNLRFEELRLLPRAKDVILAGEHPRQIFICSALTFDQLYNRSTGFRYLSTLDLVWRIRHPSAGDANRRAQILHFHERLTRPLLTLVGLFLCIPLVARRDKLSLVSNVALCMTAVGSVYACSQALLLIGQTGWISPAACAWLPLICGGSLGAWLSPIART